ncbi:MAG TPA: hypothetical protein VKX17_13000 [Planctomycetota bacterium]|nr:hypothetical protein [Planctomycetota bacterium]
MTDQEYESLNLLFAQDVNTALDALIAKLAEGPEHHALFRAKLLKKRVELGLPLINPGELKGAPPDARETYENYVETVCREIGAKYLAENNIAQAWRYFRTIGDNALVREAIEKIDPKNASDEILEIAIGQGVHPLRGFEITLERDGLCRAISTYDTEFSSDLSDKRAGAAMLVRAIYKDLVLNARKQIFERFNEYPPETDLIDLVRHRPWMFENANYHSDPSHLISVCRIGVIVDTQPEQIMALSFSEYGKLLDKRHQYEGRAPFEGGYSDYARYYRAVLGQNAEETIAFFEDKLNTYDLHSMESFPLEAILLLYWQCGKKTEALNFWRERFQYTAPEQRGTITPSYYELCMFAGDYQRLEESAKNQGDSSAWAAAKIFAARQKPEAGKS